MQRFDFQGRFNVILFRWHRQQNLIIYTYFPKIGRHIRAPILKYLLFVHRVSPISKHKYLSKIFIRFTFRSFFLFVFILFHVFFYFYFLCVSLSLAIFMFVSRTLLFYSISFYLNSSALQTKDSIRQLQYQFIGRESYLYYIC